MLSLAPLFYNHLLNKNDLIEAPQFYKIKTIQGETFFESVVFLKEQLRPSWVARSSLYRQADGCGTDIFQNIAVYKAISEALERLAFYELAESKNQADFAFDINPTTAGMAAFPHFFLKYARNLARFEAIERWAIHEFNEYHLPIRKLHVEKIENLDHYELITPFKDVFICLLAFKIDGKSVYSFAAGNDSNKSFKKALIELNRNLKVLLKANEKGINVENLKEAGDRTFLFYSTDEGRSRFQELIFRAPNRIYNSNPKVICDKELRGVWSQYTKVWRYLFEDSYFDYSSDHTFFMF